jgi:FkbM family methyltransferase
MFEPNPICVKVLEANALIALSNSEYEIFNFGLGVVDAKVMLTIPKNNWGGAYVADEHNSYNAETIKKKEPIQSNAAENFLKVEIDIIASSKALGDIFSKLSLLGFKNGVIKIDVEGYEKTIINELAKVLPNDFSICILLECWDTQSFQDISSFGFSSRKATLYNVKSFYPWFNMFPKALKVVALLFKWNIKTRFIEINKIESGDLLLCVDALKVNESA